MPLHSLRDQSAETNLAMARHQLHPTTRFDFSFCGQRGRNLDPGIGSLFFNAIDPIGHVAFMEMFKEATIVELQVVLRVYLLVGLNPSNWKESGFPVREVKVFRKEERFIGTIGMDGPLQRPVSLQSFVGHTGVQWGERSDLPHDFRGMPIVPVCA